MSSAVQTSSGTGASRQARLDATYAREMMCALAPTIDKLSACLIQGTHDSSPIAAAAQIMDLQRTLADGRTAVETCVPEQMLREGGDNIYFISTTQRPQGSWIKDTYALLANLEDRIRLFYRQQEDPITFRNELLSCDTAGVTSLPRLMRAFAKSSFFTSLHLNSPGHRSSLGITADLSARALRQYLTNNTNVV
jgi:hypothetical protein